MARGRKPKDKTPPKLPADENASYRSTVYHLCGHEIFSQPVPNRTSLGYHLVFFGTRDTRETEPLLICPGCRTRVSRQSIRLPGEQYLYEMAQEQLALELDRARNEEDETDAETQPPS